MSKEILERLILINNRSYESIGRMFNMTGAGIKKAAKRLGVCLPKRANFVNGVRIKKPKPKGKCVYCSDQIENFGKLYCSKNCESLHRKKSKYRDFLVNNEKYCRANYSPGYFKPFFLEEQNHGCAVCKIPNTWNGLNLVFVLDHIDGDASNNKRSNLRLICPNCDSQLPTFKSKNKKSARIYRYAPR